MSSSVSFLLCRWRAQRMTEDYVNLVGDIMYPKVGFGAYGYDTDKARAERSMDLLAAYRTDSDALNVAFVLSNDRTSQCHTTHTTGRDPPGAAQHAGRAPVPRAAADGHRAVEPL